MTQQEQEDQLAIAQNGGVSSSDEGEDDGDLDDDMMDRISSSPSIEDGAFAFNSWPRRVSSLPPQLGHSYSLITRGSGNEPSPYTNVAHYSPLHSTTSSLQSHRHRRSEYSEAEEGCVTRPARTAPARGESSFERVGGMWISLQA